MMREQNVVEPCWTLPLRNATFDCLERPCSNTAPASANTSDSGAASNSTTCRSSRDSKVLHAESQCFNICFTCTRWHIAASGSFMFSWNYWLMMGMSFEQNTMGKGPNLSPWGLVNKRPRQKMWERRRHRKPWALAMRREMRRVAWRKVARWSERGGVEWLSGKELGGSLEEMNPYQSVHDKLRVWQLDCSTSLAKARTKHKKNQACYTTSLRDKTLFKPTASASTGSGGPCNEHRQKAKSCGVNYEILMFHCFTLTICRSNTF